MNIIYWDVETLRLAEEVGGWGNIEQMGLSCAVASMLPKIETCGCGEPILSPYLEHQIGSLLMDMQKADKVIGFNSINFDCRVVQPYTNFNMLSLPHFDLMLSIQGKCKRRIGLDNLCKETLGVGKIGDGKDSVQWWRAGLHDKVISYCKQDVLLTRRLHEYGVQRGHVYYMDRYKGRTRVEVDW